MIPQDAFLARTNSINAGVLRAIVGGDGIVMRFLDRFCTRR